MVLKTRDDPQHRHFTYGDYLTWPDKPRYELIDGVAYAMAPAPLLEHQEYVGHIFRMLGNALVGQPCRVYVAPVDVRLPRAQEADERIDTVVQPDVLVVCDPAKLDRRGVRGAPDLAVEVLSPSTAVHDQLRKRRAYERAGVREYWLVHPTDRSLTVYLLQDGRYGAPEVVDLDGETPVTVLPGVVVPWAELIERLGMVEAQGLAVGEEERLG
jgi:Uma2 family endonuclease